MAHISSYKELRVYQKAMAAAMRIFELTKHFPIEEVIDRPEQWLIQSRTVRTTG